MSRPSMVTTGVSAPRSPCLKMTLRSGKALRPRRADVVLAHGLDEVAADHPGVERGRRHRQRDPRKDELALRDRLPDAGVDLEAR